MIPCPICAGEGVEWVGLEATVPCIDCLGRGEIPGTALILHPDPRARDIFGVISHAYATTLLAYAMAYDDAIRLLRPKLQLPNGLGDRYAFVRDYLTREFDVPYHVVCLVALYQTRPGDMFLSFTVVL